MGGVWSSGVSPNFGLRGVPGLCVRTLFHDFKDDRLMNMFDKKNHDFYFDLEKYIADTSVLYDLHVYTQCCPSWESLSW